MTARADGPGRPAPERWGDRGSGSVLVLGLLAVVAVLGGALAMLVGAQAGRSRAQTAADLGAIAGAHATLRGTDDACAVAGLVVRRHGAGLAACEVLSGGRVEVRAVVAVGPGDARASAVAGPRGAGADVAGADEPPSAAGPAP